MSLELTVDVTPDLEAWLNLDPPVIMRVYAGKELQGQFTGRITDRWPGGLRVVGVYEVTRKHWIDWITVMLKEGEFGTRTSRRLRLLVGDSVDFNITVMLK